MGVAHSFIEGGIEGLLDHLSFHTSGLVNIRKEACLDIEVWGFRALRWGLGRRRSHDNHVGMEGEGQGIYHYHNTDVSDKEEEGAIFIGHVQFGPSHYGLEGYLWRREEAVNRLTHVTYIHTPTMFNTSTTYTDIKTSMNTYMHTHIHTRKHTHTYSTYIYPNTHTHYLLTSL